MLFHFGGETLDTGGDWVGGGGNASSSTAPSRLGPQRTDRAVVCCRYGLLSIFLQVRNGAVIFVLLDLFCFCCYCY